MNLLIINSFDISTTGSGGVNRISYLLSEYFIRHFQYHCFLGFFKENPQQPTADFEAKIHLSNPLKCDEFEQFILKHHIDVVQINFIQKENVGAVPALYRIAQKHAVPVVHCFHMCPGFQMVTYGSWEKLRYCLHTGENAGQELKRLFITAFSFLFNPLFGRLMRKKYRLLLDYCDKMLVLSENYIRPFATLAGREETVPDKFSAIGNALTFDTFITPDEIAQKSKEVLIVARFEEEIKRLSMALKCWKNIEADESLNDWSLRIVGDGKDADFYRYLVKRHKLKRVVFEGRQKPLEYYRKAAVFLMTSSAEGWPMTLMEATQMGVVPIAFDSFGSLHDIIQDNENGCIVPNNRIAAFSRCLSKLMHDDTKRREMALQAMESSKRFRIEQIAGKWKEQFSAILSEES